ASASKPPTDRATGDFTIFETMFMSLKLLLAAEKRTKQFHSSNALPGSGRFPRALVLSACQAE
ncbi:hypothetical protein, partial [Rhizobium leguminosarum]|uniref:hypothetical protein n=1 Tax=Rhizobium leguminosarum TaxID=384 RepID=UPI003F9BE415